MKTRQAFMILVAFLVSAGSATACVFAPQQSPSGATTIAAARATEAAAAATQAAAVQIVAQATQAAKVAPQNTATPERGGAEAAAVPAPQTVAPTPPPLDQTSTPPLMPSPKACNTESDPLWHWQVGQPEINGFFFTNSSTGFAVGEPGAMLRTDDGGSSWRVWPVPASQPLNSIFFANEQTGWAAGENGVVLKTSDGGFTWQPQQTRTKAVLYVIKFHDDQTGWVGGANGTFLRTTDGGTTWSPGATGQQADVVDIAFIDAQEGYLVAQVGIGPVNYVLRTTDGGATWQNTDFWDTLPNTIWVAKGATPWIAGGWVGGKIWKGIGHGTQTLVKETLLSTAECRFRRIVFSDAQHGWAVGDCGLAILTEDGGSSWKPMQVTSDASWKMLYFLSDHEAVLAGYSWQDGIQTYHSSDSGQTWTSAAPRGAPTNSLGVHDVDFVDPWFGWALTFNALLATTDGGHSWQRYQTPGSGLSQGGQIEFVDRLRGWVIGEGGLIARTDDGGRTWEIQPLTFAGNLQAILFADRERGWVASADPFSATCQPRSAGMKGLTVFRTSSGGDAWEGPICIDVPDRSTTSPYHFPPRMYFVDQATGWIAGQGGSIVKTTDGGLTWQPQTTGTAMDLSDLYFLNEQNGWVTGDKGVLLSTTDGGVRWKQQRLEGGELAGVRFVTEQIGWVAVRSSGQVLSTTDGGRTWNAAEFLPDRGGVYALDAVDKSHVWVGFYNSLRAYAPVCLQPN